MKIRRKKIKKEEGKNKRRQGSGMGGRREKREERIGTEKRK